jgi:hypothetical protein
VIPFLFALAVVCLMFAAAAAFQRGEARSADLRLILAGLENERALIARKAEELGAGIADRRATALRLDEETEKLRLEAEELDAAVQRLTVQPRERIFVADRLPGRVRRIWEAAVMHDANARSPAPAFARSWSVGRRYLLTAASEKDARNRADLRFPVAGGFRVIGLKPTVL